MIASVPACPALAGLLVRRVPASLTASLLSLPPSYLKRWRNAWPAWLRDPIGRWLTERGLSLSELGTWLRESDE
jgi:hypothetical protein